jgi:hypothetical protein
MSEVGPEFAPNGGRGTSFFGRNFVGPKLRAHMFLPSRFCPSTILMSNPAILQRLPSLLALAVLMPIMFGPCFRVLLVGIDPSMAGRRGVVHNESIATVDRENIMGGILGRQSLGRMLGAGWWGGHLFSSFLHARAHCRWQRGLHCMGYGARVFNNSELGMQC